MKKSSTSLRVSVLLATSFLLYSKQAITVVAQNRTNVERPPLTEKQALKEIRSAQDVAAKLAQAKEFVNTFPASTARPELVALVATEIAKLKDSKQAVKLAEEARRSFTSAQEQETITPILLDAYAGAGRADARLRAFGARPRGAVAEATPRRQAGGRRARARRR